MPAVAAAGPETYHLRATGWPIISLLEVSAIRGAVVRPFVYPIPLYPWTMVHRRNLEHPAPTALDRAIDQLSTSEGWCEMPASGWLASADREILAAPPFRVARRGKEPT
jgi:hypothetical protein